MDRRDFIGMLGASAATTMLPGPVRAHAPRRPSNMNLVHGPFADGLCWANVIGVLSRTELAYPDVMFTQVQSPLTTLEACVAAAQSGLEMDDCPTVLVAHSYSGMILNEVGMDPKVTALVYVAAAAPDAGEDYAALARQFPKPAESAGLVWNDEFGQLSEEAFLRDVAGDLPKHEARELYTGQQPLSRALLTAKATHAAWRSKPSFYAVFTEDRTINPDLQRFMAKRMEATTIEVKGSHLAMWSQPDAVTELILEAAGLG